MNYLNGIILKNAFRKDNENKKLSNKLLAILVFIIIFRKYTISYGSGKL